MKAPAAGPDATSAHGVAPGADVATGRGEQALPQRIVSLVPSTTESLAALGVAARVVGRTRYCVHPAPWVDGVRAVGGTKDPDLAAIAALAPDLIVVNREENKPAHFPALEALAPLHVGYPRDVDGALADLRALAARVGAEAEGAALIERIELARQRMQAALRPSPGAAPPRFRYAYLIWRRPWMSVNGDTFIHALLAEAGGENVCAAAAERYPQLTLDELRAADPEVLLLASEPYPFEEEHAPEFGPLALRCQLVDGELLSWHGARLQHAFPYLATRVPAWARG
ncbi:MAG TPA: helical backbone metal receptor [Planctomycetota bacterium]|nr:helical backbone metal receptor [Planctomycetota bacterium]